MPPDAVTTTDATSMLDRIPPDVAGYVVLALIVWWLTRAAYRETSTERSQLLDRYEVRLGQLESSLSAMSQDLATSRKNEDECRERMDRLEKKYEKRIGELEHDILVFRVRLGEVSESYLDQ